jgi:hypothetical protein
MSSAQNRRGSHFFIATFSRRIAVWLSLCFLLCLANSRSYALQGNINSHDPSGLVKEGDRYYQFTTGPGIYSAYSTDLRGISYARNGISRRRATERIALPTPWEGEARTSPSAIRITGLSYGCGKD